MVKEGDLVQCVLAAGYKEQLADNLIKVEQARRFKAILYENMINCLITKDEYRYDKDQYTAQIEQASEKLARNGKQPLLQKGAV